MGIQYSLHHHQTKTLKFMSQYFFFENLSELYWKDNVTSFFFRNFN